jgi:hypothetical protein
MIETLITLAILSLNFAIVMWFKNRIALVSSVMIINLLIILLCSISISDYQNLKELIIAIIIYSITILILISNTSHIDQIKSDKSKKLLSPLAKKANYLAIVMLTLLLSYGGFYLANNIEEQSLRSDDKQIEKMTQPAAPIESPEGAKPEETKESKLKNNVLFHRSTDAILIIVGVMVTLLLSSKYRNRESNI